MTPQERAAIERRLVALERTRRAPHTSVDAGAFRVTGGGTFAVVGEDAETIMQLSGAAVGVAELHAGAVVSDTVPRLLAYTDTVTLHVDPDTGDDENDGLVDPDTGVIAWLETVQRAFDLLPEVLAGTAYIRVLDTSTVTEDVRMSGVTGGGTLTVQPCDATGTPTSVASGAGTGHIAWDGTLHLQGITLAACTVESAWLDDPGNEGLEYATLLVEAATYVQLFDLRVNANGHRNNSITVQAGSVVHILRCTRLNNGAVAAITAARTSQVLVESCEGRGPIGVRALELSRVHLMHTAPTGSSANTSATQGGTITTQTLTHTTGTTDPTTVKPRRFTYTANGSRSYRHSKFVGWRTDDRLPRQGNYGYGEHSGWWFYPDGTIRSDLEGRDITRVEVYVHRRAEGGASARVDTKLYAHGYSSQPGGAPSTGRAIDIGGLRWGEGRWFDVPVWVGNGLQDGSIRGIAVRASSRSLYAIYGTGARLRVTTG